MSFAQNLKTAMEEHHMTMYRLSLEIGVHQTTLHNWLSGRGEPKLEVIKKIAKALRVSPLSLLDFDEPIESEEEDEASEREYWQRLLVKNSEKLNAKGSRKVAEMAIDLTKIPDYQKVPNEED